MKKQRTRNIKAVKWVIIHGDCRGIESWGARGVGPRPIFLPSLKRFNKINGNPKLLFPNFELLDD